MIVVGLQTFTLTDFPGRVAAVVFTQGCNFRCPFCHNGSLLPMEPDPDTLIPEEDVCSLLEQRRGKLDGVMLSGGEPTLQPDLPEFLRRVRAMGFDTGLETNGSHPEVIAALLSEGLLDFVAMDIKAPSESYDKLSGVRAPVERIRESIELIAAGGIEHEFRTTVVEALLSPEDIVAIERLVPDGSPHKLQKFIPENALDPKLREAH